MSDDSKIIELFCARDEQAIVKLSEKYGDICKRISKNILKNESDAEECVNDSYLAVWNTVPPENPDPLKTYLLRIVRNISIAKYHANTSKKRNSHYDIALEELEDCLAEDTDLFKRAENGELSYLIDRFLASLDKTNRILFMRRYWYSDSIADIAKRFCFSPNTVSARLSRIREKLKKFLKEEGFDP